MSLIVSFSSASRGSALLEVLITVVIVGLGLLGLAGLQARFHVLEYESYQRAQAVVIMNDIVERISANRDIASSYVATIGGTGALVDCSSLSGAALDLCELGNQLKGAGEQKGGSSIGAMSDGKACITAFTATATKSFGRCQTGVQIDVVWRGRSSTIIPVAACGAGEFGSDDGYRRAISTRVGTGDTSC